MKNLLRFPLFFLVALLLSSCWGIPNDEDVPTENYEPVLMTRTEFENAVKALAPKEIVKSGKIYIKDNLMFINDVNKGFHVYNYSNPQNPIKISFIQIPGATDLALRNNIIYINQAVDLVTLEYNPVGNLINVTKRIKEVFPQKIAPDGFSSQNGSNKIVIDWIPKN